MINKYLGDKGIHDAYMPNKFISKEFASGTTGNIVWQKTKALAILKAIILSSTVSNLPITIKVDGIEFAKLQISPGAASQIIIPDNGIEFSQSITADIGGLSGSAYITAIGVER
jgi:hypothetical protein